MKKVKSPFFEKVYNLYEYNHPHEFDLPKKPYVIDVELTNNCNLSCVFCDRQTMKREKGYMDIDVFKKLGDEASKLGVVGFRFIRWGEHYLHPGIFDAIKYAKEKGLLTHVTTNGLLLNEEKAEKTINSGLDTIIFSMQGTGKEGYEEQRGSKEYNRFVKNIEHLVSLREKLNADNPFIQVTTTTLDESEEQIKSWKDYWNGKVDLATHTGPTSLYRVKNLKRVRPFLPRYKLWKRDKLCNEVFNKLAVNWNGDITACANDYDNFLLLGNIKKDSLEEIWNSEKLNEIRDILKKNNQEEINKKVPFCSYCRNRF